MKVISATEALKVAAAAAAAAVGLLAAGAAASGQTDASPPVTQEQIKQCREVLNPEDRARPGGREDAKLKAFCKELMERKSPGKPKPGEITLSR